ncbi:MAG: hypothetical protein ACP5P4_11085 [Steroidobacteraceae bacterium]
MAAPQCDRRRMGVGTARSDVSAPALVLPTLARVGTNSVTPWVPQCLAAQATFIGHPCQPMQAAFSGPLSLRTDGARATPALAD